MAILLNADDLTAHVRRSFPTEREVLVVEDLDEQSIRMRMRIDTGNLRPGATVSGPTIFTLVDTVAWLATLAHLGPGREAVTSSVNINYLRRPQLADLLGEGRLLKLGSRFSVTDVLVFSEGLPDPVAQATVTYAPV